MKVYLICVGKDFALNLNGEEIALQLSRGKMNKRGCVCGKEIPKIEYELKYV